jgi:GDP-mannose 6-dehydrogenase
LERLIAQAVRRKILRASLDPAEALQDAEVSLVCVGTPSRRNGEADLDHVLHAVREIGLGLRRARRFHTVVVRSTVPPGTLEERVIPSLERASGRRAGRDFGVCFHPEFLREGSSIQDFFHPPFNILGCHGARSAVPLLELWRSIPAPLLVTSVKVAELLKYASNAFHGLKVAFANEIGALAKSLGVDGREVMGIFVQDKKLNVSSLYLQPGFAFGGPCLPKDLRALDRVGRRSKLDLPLLASILRSNATHLQRAVDLVLETGKKRIGILGLAFKPGTDDLRGSPACALAQRLLRAGRKVRIYDPSVQLSRLVGANREYVQKQLPQLPRLLRSSAREVLAWSQVLVVTRPRDGFPELVGELRKGQILIDLVRLATVPRRLDYRGICW